MSDIEFNIDIDVSSVISELDNLVSQVEKQTKKTLKKIARIIQENARKVVKVNDSQLRNSIKTKVFHTNATGEYTGSVYVTVADVPYLLYVYYGTGVHAKMGNKSSRGADNTWFVPAHKVTKDVSRYGWVLYKNSKGGDFYVVHGQEDNPFLDIAFESTQKQCIDLIEKEIGGLFK